MAQLIVRQLEDDVKERLKQRARRRGHSLEQELRELLRAAASAEGQPVQRLGSRIAGRFRGAGLDTELPELRGQAPRPAALDR
jgi:plasmid stability protein